MTKPHREHKIDLSQKQRKIINEIVIRLVSASFWVGLSFGLIPPLVLFLASHGLYRIEDMMFNILTCLIIAGPFFAYGWWKRSQVRNYIKNHVKPARGKSYD